MQQVFFSQFSWNKIDYLDMWHMTDLLGNEELKKAKII